MNYTNYLCSWIRRAACATSIRKTWICATASLPPGLMPPPLHGFQRFEPPVVESFELLARKAGEEVAQQIYHFEDKSNRQLALRPEVTPSLVRMISARPQQIVFPAKWWTIGQCFRYERMTRGRKREHFQWNLDIVGEPSVQAEAWILACVTSALAAWVWGRTTCASTSITGRWWRICFASWACRASSMWMFSWCSIRKAKCRWRLCKRCWLKKGWPPQTADARDGQLAGEAADSLSSGPLAASPAAEDVRRLLDLADAMGFGEYLRFDSGVVRGLSYYTGAVFEGFDTERRFRAIFGGGRYDNLFGDMTGTPARQWAWVSAMWSSREILAELKGWTPAKPKVDVCVGMFDAALSQDTARVAAELVAAGIQTDLAFSAGKPGKFFSYADRRGARFTVFLAPNELRDGAAVVKEMASGEQSTVPLAELAGWLRQRLRA